MTGVSSNGDAPRFPRSRGATDHERIVTAEADASLTEAEQSASDADQTSADGDQTSADRDQGSADSDQEAADRDQVASDRDLASGGDRATHQLTKDVREETSEQRDRSALARLETSAHRDEVARQRDAAALARDQAADAHDEVMRVADEEERRKDREHGDAASEFVVMAAARRRRAAQARAKAAAARVRAAEDREAARDDRERAARERVQAHEEHQRLLAKLAAAETDQLTGARMRAAGLVDVEHELDRCQRSGAPLVVAYLDVVGLKTINDTQGHAAGDEWLKRVVSVAKAHLRSYDLVVRLGGDEFLCVMSDATLPDAQMRFEAIAVALAPAPGVWAFRVGFAVLERDDDAARLIARADDAMIRDRRGAVRPSAAPLQR